MISAIVAFSLPNLILSIIVVENITGSCGTIANIERKSFNDKSVILNPPNNIEPEVRS
jgi:hypothetical protein